MVGYSTTGMAPRRRVSTVLIGRVLWALVLALPACAANPEWIYDKPRTTPAEFDQDKTACRKVAPSRSMFKTFQAEKVDRPVFNRCMEKRGYTVKVAPLP
jgi:hypothetical protein